MSDSMSVIINALKGLQEGQLNLFSRIEKMHGSIDDVRTDLTTVRTDLITVSTDLNKLRVDVTARMDRFENDLTRLRVDVMERMERFENSLTAIRDDIGVNMGAAERARLATDNTRDEVRLLGDQLATMWRQIKRLESEVRDIRGEPAWTTNEPARVTGASVPRDRRPPPRVSASIKRMRRRCSRA